MAMMIDCGSDADTARARHGKNQVMSEPELLERVAQGDSAATQALVDKYGGLVWSYARRFTTTNADAEDAVQDIFVSLWQCAKSFRPEVASEATFISMIARRRLIDRARRKSKVQTRAVEFDRIPSEHQESDVLAELNDEAAQAAELLETLPDPQSRAIKLAVYDGLSHSQIAELTGLSLGTVKTHIRRGFIRMREQLMARSSTVVKGGVS